MNTEFVDSVFSRVPNIYDRMNDIMSMGWHHVWKNILMYHLWCNHMPATIRWMDIACGTGDLCDIMIHMCKKHETHHPQDKIHCHMVCVDPQKQMLTLAQRKYAERNDHVTVRWVEGYAHETHVPDHSMDACTTSFGLRNMADRAASLKTIFQALVPGGIFYCLEFSQPTHPLTSWLLRRYLSILPWIGHYVAKEKDAYTYLKESILSFPSIACINMELHKAGFCAIKATPLSHGIVALHEARKPHALESDIKLTVGNEK